MKHKQYYFMLLLLILLSSCLSSSVNNSSNSTSQWFFNLEKADLAPGEIKSITDGNATAEIEEISNFGKIAWLYSLLETFELHQKMPIEDKIILLDSLFNAIPSEADGKINRATAIGDYFGENEHLIIYSTNFKPSDKAPQGSKIIVDFTGNFIMTKNNETGEVKKAVSFKLYQV